MVFNDILDVNTTLITASITSTLGIITSGNTSDDTSVGVDIGTIASGDSVVISFQVIISNSLPADVTQVTNQGTVNTDTNNDETITSISLPSSED